MLDLCRDGLVAESCEPTEELIKTPETTKENQSQHRQPCVALGYFLTLLRAPNRPNIANGTWGGTT